MNAGAPARAKKAYLSIGLKLTGPLVLLVAAVACFGYVGIVRMARNNLLQSKATAANMVVKLFAASVSPAVVFSDESETQRSVDDLAKNPEVTDVEVWPAGKTASAQPDQPLAVFHRGNQEQQHIDVSEPILGANGEDVAVAKVRFSLEREHAALQGLAKQILGASTAAAIAFAAAILLLLARVVVVPLGRLERAAVELGKGDNTRGIEGREAIFDDEVGRLATAFQQMAEAVEDRERKLSARNTELKLILDNVSQGFLTVLADGTLQSERSAIVETWLGKLPEKATFGDVIERLGGTRARQFAEMGWSQIDDGFLPLEVCIGQLPQGIVRGNRHFELSYHPVLRGESLERMVIVLSDVTSEVERRRGEEERREFASLVDRLVHDRGGFLDFWNETSALVSRLLSEQSSPNLKRDLHTLKGNTRFFGMWRLSTLCHELEDALEERRATDLEPGDRAKIRAEWTAINARIEKLTRGGAFVELSEEEFGRLSEAIRTHQSYEVLAKKVAELRYEPTRRRLERARDIVTATCEKLGKRVPVFHLEHHDLRLPPGRWATFWSTFTHVLVNAADHGLETDVERAASGKKAPASLWLETTMRDGELVVSVRDDGRGIDWDRVRKLAADRGIAHDTQADLDAALLSEGLSTKTAVADVSGRGVGLSAVRAVVEEMGGRIELESTFGVGTEWRFVFPL